MCAVEMQDGVVDGEVVAVVDSSEVVAVAMLDEKHAVTASR